MNELLFTIPLAAGVGILLLAGKWQIPKGPEMNRPLLGAGIIATSLLWWLSSAILLVQQEKFYFILNILTVVLFFTGLAYFLPKPHEGAVANEHSLPAQVLIWTGMTLGCAHSLALMFTTEWPAMLLDFYVKLGIPTGTPPT